MFPARLAPVAVAIAALYAPVSHALTIGDIQGTEHLSSFAGSSVSGIDGIVTAVSTNGFWMQDVVADANPLTSDGIFVYTGGRARPSVGDRILASGRVDEYRPGGAATNLTTTELNLSFGANGWSLVSSSNALPTAVVIGAAGILPPTGSIAPDVGNVETSGHTLAPGSYAMDFYESLEGMRVSLASAAVVGPNARYGEVAVVSSDQVGATLTNSRGGVTISSTSFNAQRIILDDVLRTTPVVNVGDLLNNVVGVLDYSFSNYKLQITDAPTVIDNGLVAEVAAPLAANRLAIASYNVENLGGDASASRFSAIAQQIVGNLASPHLIALQEVQDNNGATDNGVVAADQTLDQLTAAIKDAGGRDYGYVVIDPINKNDGGQPGGNIRNAYLYDTSIVSFAGTIGGATDAIAVNADGSLTLDAGRVDPANVAFDDSRKALVAQFDVAGENFILINTHFNSKGGDEPLFGPDQAPERDSEIQRLAQAGAVAGFVGEVLAIDPDAKIIALGDFNDFQFSDTLAPLTDAGLVNLTSLLPEEERYTYIYEGNSQALDHMFVSAGVLADSTLAYDIIHANSEFAAQISDHDPLLLTLAMPVPEPETWALMLAGFALVARRARRKA